jgi:hypothetical protein
MAIIWTDEPPARTYSGLMLVDELLRLKRVAANKRHAREAVAAYRGESGQSGPSDAPSEPVAPPLTLSTDCAGSPSESFNWQQYRAVVEARKREL